MSEYKADPCPCGRGEQCDGQAIAVRGTPEHEQCVAQACGAILDEALGLMLTGLASEEVRDGYLKSAIERAEKGAPPVAFDVKERLVKVADVLQVYVDGLREAAKLDYFAIGAQARIDPEVH